MSSTSSRPFVPWVKRTDNACSNCRRRKIKCKISKERPKDPCERCVKRRLCCQYMSVAEQEDDSTSPESTPGPSTPLPPPPLTLPTLPFLAPTESPPRPSGSRHFYIDEPQPHSEFDLDRFIPCPLRSSAARVQSASSPSSSTLPRDWDLPFHAEQSSHLGQFHFPSHPNPAPNYPSLAYSLRGSDGTTAYSHTGNDPAFALQDDAASALFNVGLLLETGFSEIDALTYLSNGMLCDDPWTRSE
ncbi:hypothetical protein R3P38DRAFT_3204425 [Favolaschia claudopus]|uniref:Zn(2)-C6 fungal-type domain-containing protein n=1 Tax=Favolaschia claudopus TaxID=2862362 RepID=A0AAW0AQJ4_9AGAR